MRETQFGFMSTGVRWKESGRKFMILTKSIKFGYGWKVANELTVHR